MSVIERMLLYVLRRLCQTVPLLLVISALIFTLLYLMPGDPLYRMLEGIPNLRPEDYDRLRKLYGFDDPVYVQYGKWLWQLLQLNPGYSREYGQPVFDIILPALKNTLVLTIAAVVIGQVDRDRSGNFFRRAAVFHRRLSAHRDDFCCLFGAGVLARPDADHPVFRQARLAADLRHRSIASSTPGSWEATVDWIKHLILPVAVLAISEIIQVQRFMRSSLLEVLRQDYLTTARAKGLSENVVIGRHALKNALIPVVTIIAVTMPRVVGGSTVVETVFAYPGMGRLLYTSIMGNDYVVAMTVVMIIAVTVVGFNLLADVIYGWLDPRIRYQS